MTEKQRRFVDNYIATANASEAARLSGYSKRSAYSTGERLLRKAEVSAKIEERLKEMDSERIITNEKIFEHLSDVIAGKMTETVFTPGGKVLTLPVRESDRLRAAEMVLKVRGQFKDKVDVKVDGAQLFVDTLTKISAKLEDDDD